MRTQALAAVLTAAICLYPAAIVAADGPAGPGLDAPTTVVSGDSVPISATGFQPGERVRLTLDGRSRGSIVAGADGSFATEVTIPATAAPDGSTLGQQRIVATGLASHLETDLPLTIQPPRADPDGPQTMKFATPGDHSVDIPAGAKFMKVTASGAQGGGGIGGSGSTGGGLGAKIIGTFDLASYPGVTRLEVVVGGEGGFGGTLATEDAGVYGYGGGGGGGSFVWTGAAFPADSASMLLIVAGGGGGGGGGGSYGAFANGTDGRGGRAVEAASNGGFPGAGRGGTGGGNGGTAGEGGGGGGWITPGENGPFFEGGGAHGGDMGGGAGGGGVVISGFGQFGGNGGTGGGGGGNVAGGGGGGYAGGGGGGDRVEGMNGGTEVGAGGGGGGSYNAAPAATRANTAGAHSGDGQVTLEFTF